MPDLHALLKRYFGYDAFRPGQEELVTAICRGFDVLGILPTGGGKSVCYQLPALVMPGLAVVVSPLISLMHDQVASLTRRRIPAECITSELDAAKQSSALTRAARGELKFLYVAPERLQTSSFLNFACQTPISLLVIDEAHSISLWGREFRPSYLKIADFIEGLPRRPVVAAFTATATARVQEEIALALKLRRPFRFCSSFDRPNLYYEVRHPADRRKELFALLSGYRDVSGIIYCLTRKGTERLARSLLKAGFSAAPYHAGLAPSERAKHQNDWLSGAIPIIVATNAFGMGIDKPDVRFVIHYQMPGSLENYYQEAGRAGRDGAPSDCILLYNDSDIKANRFFIGKTRSPALRKIMRAQLESMRIYAGGKSCLRAYLRDYFENGSAARRESADCVPCGSCSVCLRRMESSASLPIGREDHALYRSLIAVRLRIAGERGIPPYKVLPDAALHDLAALRPERMRDLLLMESVPLWKGIKYGADLLQEISTWNASH